MAAQEYSGIALFTHGVLLGILFAGFILMFIIFLSARTRLHLTMFLFNSVSLAYAVLEGLILVSFFLHNPEWGRQFHRLQAVTIALFIPLMPAFLETTVALSPRMQVFNRALLYGLLTLTALIVAAAFAAPDLFVSVEHAFRAATPVNMRWISVRGQTGPLYPLRDAVVVSASIYMFTFFLINFIKRPGLRYILLPIIGLIIVIFMALIDIVFLYTDIEAVQVLSHFSSLTSIGITTFIVLSVISVVRRYQSESREIDNARKIESLGTLAGGIAHDFNNLLTAVIGYVSLVRGNIPAGSENAEYLAEAETASARAQELAGQLLSLSRGGGPKKMLFSLPLLLEDTAASVPPNGRIQTDFDFDPQLKTIYADRAQISQLFQNLVVNAFQAMPEGGRISIAAHNARPDASAAGNLAPGPYVKVVVRDTGTGIKKADQTKLFEPFFSTKGKGHGLGLTIAHRIVTLHDGLISVASKEGEGTAFTVYLPACDEALPKNEAPAPNAPAAGGRVLYLEDDPTVAAVGGKIFGCLGMAADTCAAGEQAVERFREARDAGRPYDFVLLDIVIAQGLGGIETVKTLRGLDPGLKAAATSGYSDNDIALNFKKYGFDAFLPKPFQLEDVKTLAAKMRADPPRFTL